jgi:small neutral amino acid transporter SnatA (MarC family)
MVGSMLVGTYVLELFGITLPIVRVGGGLIVAASAWRLLNASHASDDRRTTLAESYTPEQARRQAFYPLTFPISCGPGSIAAAITVGVALNDTRLSLSLARMGGGVLALLTIGLLLYLAFRYAQQLLKPLGEAGSVIFLRLSAFILLCLGVQIVWDGLRVAAQSAAVSNCFRKPRPFAMTLHYFSGARRCVVLSLPVPAPSGCAPSHGPATFLSSAFTAASRRLRTSIRLRRAASTVVWALSTFR